MLEPSPSPSRVKGRYFIGAALALGGAAVVYTQLSKSQRAQSPVRETIERTEEVVPKMVSPLALMKADSNPFFDGLYLRNPFASAASASSPESVLKPRSVKTGGQTAVKTGGKAGAKMVGAKKGRAKEAGDK